MHQLIDFFSLSDPNVRIVVLGSILLTASAAVVGCFSFLRKRALVGDVVAHSVLPGICLSFLLYQEKHPLLLMAGAFVSGWISVAVMEFISNRSRIKEDTALALVLSVFFGFGILLLTYIQHSGNASQTGLDSFLFGKAASMVKQDLLVFGGLAVLLLVLVILFFKEFTLLSFDEQYARTMGLPVKGLKILLTSLTVLAIVTGIQAVGVVLMAAMLITPAAAARFWTDKIKLMLLLAGFFGAISGITGAFISYLDTNMPTGPWIILVISFMAFISFLVAPKKGILSRLLRNYNYKRQILEENILKTLFQLGEDKDDYYQAYTIDEILSKREINLGSLKRGLRTLLADGFVTKAGNTWKLTAEGKEKGQRVTRKHRLWEVYLTNYLNIAPDHVHEDAETIEHILTPELEKRIEEILKKPQQDPHSTNIPYKE